MAERTKRKDAKLYVRISSKLDEQVNELADFIGTTKSALITYYIAQGVKQEQMRLSATKKMSEPETMAKLLKAMGISGEDVQNMLDKTGTQ